MFVGCLPDDHNAFSLQVTRTNLQLAINSHKKNKKLGETHYRHDDRPHSLIAMFAQTCRDDSTPHDTSLCIVMVFFSRVSDKTVAIK